jgi:hypothetical protein
MGNKTLYTESFLFYMTPEMGSWIAKQVMATKEKEGIFSKASKAAFLRGLIQREMDKE